MKDQRVSESKKAKPTPSKKKSIKDKNEKLK